MFIVGVFYCHSAHVGLKFVKVPIKQVTP